jgi:hypothetical protein
MAMRSWLASVFPPEANVRSEIWRLGNRHRGDALEGAREELKAPGLAPARAQLLRACVRQLRRDRRPLSR